MNRTKIEWCDWSWNPITGCLHGCSYCYARRLAEGRLKNKYPNGFQPTFWPERLDEPYQIKKPSKIFVCSMGDLFGDWVPRDWILRVLKVAEECPQHTFIFLTKNPIRLIEFNFPPNAWVGVTLDRMQLVRWELLRDLESLTVRFISFEPLLCFDEVSAAQIFFHQRPPEWVIVGGLTGPQAVQPKHEWVETIISLAREAGTAVFLKDNLDYPEKIREFPGEMMKNSPQPHNNIVGGNQP